MHNNKGYTSLQDKEGKPFASMKDFMLADWPYGLGILLEHVERLRCLTEWIHSDACEMAAVEPQKEHGGKARNQNAKRSHENEPDGVRSDSGVGGSYGNSRKYRSSRMKRDYPEMAQRVARGEIGLLDAERELGITKEHIEKIKRIRELLDKTGLKLLGVRPSKGTSGPEKGCESPNPSGKKQEEAVGATSTNSFSSRPGHGTTSHAYRASRMARDYPEMFAKVARSEITLLDAERELGIAREDRRISLPEDPAKARERIIAKFGQDFFDAMVGAV